MFNIDARSAVPARGQMERRGMGVSHTCFLFSWGGPPSPVFCFFPLHTYYFRGAACDAADFVINVRN